MQIFGIERRVLFRCPGVFHRSELIVHFNLSSTGPYCKCRLGNRNMSTPNMGWLTWTFLTPNQRGINTYRSEPKIYGGVLNPKMVGETPTNNPNPWVFPTKNDQLMGGCFGVPPFKETPI